MASFADMNVSQGIVATYTRCSGIFNIHLTYDKFTKESSSEFFLISSDLTELWHESVAPFFGPTCISVFRAP